MSDFPQEAVSILEAYREARAECERLNQRIAELEVENATLREHLSPTWHNEGVGPGRRD